MGDLNKKALVQWLLAVLVLAAIASWIFGLAVAAAALAGWIAFPVTLSLFGTEVTDGGKQIIQGSGPTRSGPNSQVPIEETVVAVKRKQKD